MKRILVLLSIFAAQAAWSQSYPAKPIRVISTFTAGSPADALMRMAAQKMGDAMGQAVVVEVQAGAGGLVGAQAVARSAPDGYTLLYTLATTIVTTPQLVKTRPYELKDFTPIVVVSKAATCMLVSASFPPSTVRELVDYAKANPGKLAYGSNGIGGTYHLEMEMLKQKNGLDITHVPYKGGTDALMAVVAGTIPIAFAPVASALAQVKAGKVKIIGALEYKRLPDFPDVPVLGEQMVDYEKIASGVDLYGPAGLPPALLRHIHGEVVKAFALPDVRTRLKEIAFPWDGTGPEEMLAVRRKDLDITARALKIAGLRAE